MYYLSQMIPTTTNCTINEPVIFNSEDEIIQVALAILANRCKKGAYAVNDPEALGKYLALSLGEETREVFGVVLLDNQYNVIDMVPLFFGTISSASVYPREIIKLVVERNAANAVLYHNHPSGLLEPSRADIDITKKIKNACEIIDVNVVDHIIVSSKGFLSFAEKGIGPF